MFQFPSEEVEGLHKEMCSDAFVRLGPHFGGNTSRCFPAYSALDWLCNHRLLNSLGSTKREHAVDVMGRLLDVDLIRAVGPRAGPSFKEGDAWYRLKDPAGGDEPEPASGTVTVHVLQAHSLPALDKTGTSDPYAEVSMGSNLYKTSVKPRTLSPQWDETFELDTDDLHTAVLRVELFDKDRFGADYMGRVTVPMDVLPLEGRSVRHSFHVRAPDGGNIGGATLDLILSFVAEGRTDDTRRCSTQLLDPPGVPRKGGPFNVGGEFFLDNHVQDSAHPPPFREDSVEEVCWYRQFFIRNEHHNYIATHDTMGDVVVSILGVEGEDTIGHQLYVIVWRRDKIIRRVVDTYDTRTYTLSVVLAHIDPVLASHAKLFVRVEDKSLIGKLEKLEYDAPTVRMKLGVLFAREGQTEEDEMYSNEHGSPAFEDFLDLLGERVRLKGLGGYVAQLDTQSDNSGTHSVRRVYHGCEIMFHVSTLLRYDETDLQRVQRKRFIGNDIVMIVFMDGSTPYDVTCMRSQYTNFISVVQYDSKDPDHYQLSSGLKRGLRHCGPEQPPVHLKDEEFIETLLSKCMNGERATYASPEFAIREKRTRQKYLEAFVSDYLPNGKKVKDADVSVIPVHPATALERATTQVFVPSMLGFIPGEVLCTASYRQHALVGTSTGVFCSRGAVPGAAGTYAKVVDMCSVVELRVDESTGLLFVRTGQKLQHPAEDPVEEAPVVVPAVGRRAGTLGLRGSRKDKGSRKEKQSKKDKGPLAGLKAETTRSISMRSRLITSTPTNVISQIFAFVLDEVMQFRSSPGIAIVPYTKGTTAFAVGCAEGKKLLCAARSNSVEVLEVVSHGEYNKMHSAHLPVRVVAVAVTGSGILAGTAAGTVVYFPLGTMAPVTVHSPPVASVPRVLFALDAHVLVCYDYNAVLLDGKDSRVCRWASFEWRGLAMSFVLQPPFLAVVCPAFIEIRSLFNGALVETHPFVSPTALHMDGSLLFASKEKLRTSLLMLCPKDKRPVKKRRAAPTPAPSPAPAPAPSPSSPAPPATSPVPTRSPAPSSPAPTRSPAPSSPASVPVPRTSAKNEQQSAFSVRPKPPPQAPAPAPAPAASAPAPAASAPAAAASSPSGPIMRGTTLEFAGQWAEETAGGCVNFPSVGNNPQYFLKTTSDGPTKVTISLTQHGGTLHSIGIVVANLDGRRVAGAIGKRAHVSSSGNYTNLKMVDCCVSLPPLSSAYTILVGTFNPGESAPFTVTIEADQPVEVEESQKPDLFTSLTHRACAAGEWWGDTAGGCLNFPSVKMNPQFLLSLTASTRCLITLKQKTQPAHPVGLTILNKKGQRHENGLFKGERIADSGKYINAAEVACDEMVLDVLPGGVPYTLLPTTFNPGQEGEFEVVVHSDRKVGLVPAPEYQDPTASLTHFAEVSSEWRGRTAGGCVNHPNTVGNNPMFTVTVAARARMIVNLTQIGCVFQVGAFLGSSVQDLCLGRHIAGTSTYVNLDAVSFEAELDPGSYVLFASTFSPGQEGAFAVNLRSSQPVVLAPLVP